MLANAASYLLLIAWYWLASAQPTASDVKLVTREQLQVNPDVRVLYISPQGTEVRQLRFNGSSPSTMLKLSTPSPHGVLGFVAKESEDRWRLELQSDYDGPLQFVAEIRTYQAATRTSSDGNVDWFFPGPADDLENEIPSKWTVRSGFWASGGINVLNNRIGESRFIMAVEVPWIAWSIGNVTILPNDQLVFQLGEQIMCVDLSRNIVAAIAAGHGPVVVLDHAPTTQSTTR